MTPGSPDRTPDHGRTPEQARVRQIALFVVGIAVVLLVSSVTWFGSDRAGWGVAQLVVAVVVAVVGAVLYRRASDGRGR
ncbi:hypothetical protein [Blastococcus sp. CCUG 61487]|uniref:hypothetical protein n=1 Tax=Blastococcus sp. CCUG 61487 TaxID=1840703 RepID=UPI0010C15110|nr:hypothetical protein [Blastococcus sp. CCUG 61487]TKJ22854.1 hypothetical protein A6V29_06020 [Blastococcus sp. CCUG 61487]